MRLTIDAARLLDQHLNPTFDLIALISASLIVNHATIFLSVYTRQRDWDQ